RPGRFEWLEPDLLGHPPLRWLLGAGHGADSRRRHRERDKRDESDVGCHARGRHANCRRQLLTSAGAYPLGMASPMDARVTALARRLADLGSGGQTGKAAVVQSSWWSERMLEWAMSLPSFKTQLFRF